ncbi:MAG: trigger factor [Chloroflexi bacterium]|nr:trigger factor [Chloroflexota bacterium]
MFTVTKELLPDEHHAKLTVTFEKNALEQAKRKIARAYAKHLRFPGFRPGKAPYALVARRVGEETLTQEAIQELLDSNYEQILETAEVKADGPAQVEEIVSYEPLTVVLRVPLQPEIHLDDYSDLRIPYEPPQVSDEEVDQALDSWRRIFIRMEPVERAAQFGDVVIMDLEGQIQAPGQEPQSIDQQEVSLLVKEDEDPEEWPFPGFSKQLAGLNIGDEATLSYTYPDDAATEHMRGKTVTYKLRVKEIQEPKVPELTDEFVRENTEYASVDALREAMRHELQQRRSAQYAREYENQVLDALLERATIRYPKERLESEARYLSQLTDTELDLDKEEVRQEVEKHLKKRLLLSHIAEQEQFELGEQELNQILAEVAEDLLAQLNHDVRELQRFQKKHPEVVQELFLQRLVQELRRKALEHVVRVAKGEVEAEEQEQTASAAEPATDEAEVADTPDMAENEPEAQAEAASEAAPAEAADQADAPAAAEEGESEPAVEAPEADDEASTVAENEA